VRQLNVIYDACVLYPAPLRSLLMYPALTDLFRARWTDAIHEEWMRIQAWTPAGCADSCAPAVPRHPIRSFRKKALATV